MCCLPNNNHLTSTTYEQQGHRQRQTRGNGSVENCGVVFLSKMLFFTSMDIKGKKKKISAIAKGTKTGIFHFSEDQEGFWTENLIKYNIQKLLSVKQRQLNSYNHMVFTSTLKKKKRDTEKISVRPRSYVRSTASWKKWQREMVLTLMTIRTYIEHVLNRSKLHLNSKGLASLATNFIEFLRPISMLPSR